MMFRTTSLRRVAVLVAAMLATLPAHAGWFLRVKPAVVQVVNATPGSVSTLAPDSTWTRTAGSSSGTAPQPDGVAYGAQAISAVGTDAAMHGVPQLTVPSTALMADGDEFRVDGTGLAGVDGQSQLHIVDATHIDLCDTVAASGDCTISANLRPTVQTAGYAGGGQVWFDETAIAQWDEHPSAWIEGSGYTITVGAAAGTRAWIKDVKFCFDNATDCVDATGQTLSPTHNTFGWAVQPTSRGLLAPGGAADGIANLYAVVTPQNGFQRVLGPLPVILNTNGTIPHAQLFVDNTDPKASDTACNGLAAQGAAGETASNCPWKTLEKAACSAFTASAAQANTAGQVYPIVNVGGPAGQLYNETDPLGCTASTSPFTVKFTSANGVYVSAQVSANGGENWKIKALNTVWENFAIDDEMSGVQTPAGAMMFVGQGSKLVSWNGVAGGTACAAGDPTCNYGALGHPYGYSFAKTQINSQNIIGDFPVHTSAASWYGVGEANFDTVSAGGWDFYRNVTANASLDAIQTQRALTVFNYHANVAHTATTRYETDANTPLTVASVSACNTSTSPNQLTVTWTTPAYDAYQTVAPPNFLTMFTGAAGNGGSLHGQSGAPGNYPLAPPGASPYGFPLDGNGKILASGTTTTIQGLTASGCPNIQPGDTGMVWSEGHSDCLQVIGQAGVVEFAIENTYFQNYQCSGDNLQPILFQVGNYTTQTPTVTTQGKSFTFSSAALYDVGDFLNVPSKTAAVANPPADMVNAYQSRRITAVTRLPTASFTGVFTSGSKSFKVTLDASSPPLLPGMLVTPHDGIFSGSVVVASQDALQSGDVAGGNGTYELLSAASGSVTKSSLKGNGITGGTLAAPFGTDITTPTTLYVGNRMKDFACVNCLLDAAYTDPLAGIAGQFIYQNRHTIFVNTTMENTGYRFSVNTVQAGFGAEAVRFMDSMIPYLGTGNQSGLTISTLTSAGYNVSNTQYLSPTSTFGLALSGATPAASGTTYSFLAGLPSALDSLGNALTLPTIGAADMAAVPFDINHAPRAVGAPIGATAY